MLNHCSWRVDISPPNLLYNDVGQTAQQEVVGLLPKTYSTLWKHTASYSDCISDATPHTHQTTPTTPHAAALVGADYRRMHSCHRIGRLPNPVMWMCIECICMRKALILLAVESSVTYDYNVYIRVYIICKNASLMTPYWQINVGPEKVWNSPHSNVW